MLSHNVHSLSMLRTISKMTWVKNDSTPRNCPFAKSWLESYTILTRPFSNQRVTTNCQRMTFRRASSSGSERATSGGCPSTGGTSSPTGSSPKWSRWATWATSAPRLCSTGRRRMVAATKGGHPNLGCHIFRVANDHDCDLIFGLDCCQQSIPINFWLNRPQQHDRDILRRPEFSTRPR